MRLKYHILWVENEKAWKNVVEKQIKRHLNAQEFELVVTWRPNGDILDEEEVKAGLNTYDLILVDYDLGTQKNGSDFIREIRDKNVYVDVIFYSIDFGGMEGSMKSNKLEGVFLSPRNVQSFEEKVRKIIDTTLRKLQSLPAMRGLVMTETSELDEKMQKIMELFLSSADNSMQDKVSKYILEKLNDSFARNSLTLKNLEGSGDLRAIAQSKIIDASKMNLLVAKALEVSGIIEDKARKKWIEDYGKEIIQVRNKMAHCVEVYHEGHYSLQTKEGKIESFTHDQFVQIRKSIRNQLNTIEQYVSALVGLKSQSPP